MNLSQRTDVEEKGRPDPETSHNLVFGVVKKNLDKLEQTLLEVSTPGNPNYGKHWTRDQINELTKNPEAHDAIVSFLRRYPGVEITSESNNGEYINATAPVRVWDEILQTEFQHFQVASLGEQTFVRCKSFRLPTELVGHVQIVQNTVDLPQPKVVRPHPHPVGGVHRGGVRLQST